MRSLLALGLALCVLIPLADASSDAQAFTQSHLISYGSDFSALRTVSNNLIATPDLNFQSFGEVNTDLAMSGGTSEIEQSLYFSAEKTDGFSGYGSLSHSFTAENALYADSKMKCGGLSTATHSYDATKVESTATGLTLALPGSDDYQLSLAGGYNTRTTATTIPVPLWVTEEARGFSVTFDPYDLDFDQPADFLSQNTDIDFRVSENDLAYYGYDFERELEVGDISCRVDMQLQHVERDI